MIFFNFGFGGGDGGGRGQVIGQRGIEVLLGHEIGMVLVDRLQPSINQVCVGIIRLGLLLGGDGIVQFRLQFRHFDRRQKLASLDFVAKVYIHFTHIAGNFGGQLNFRIRAEFRRNVTSLNKSSRVTFATLAVGKVAGLAFAASLCAHAMRHPHANQADGKSHYQDLAKVSKSRFCNFEFH